MEVEWAQGSGMKIPTGSRDRVPVVVWGQNPYRSQICIHNLQLTNAFLSSIEH